MKHRYIDYITTVCILSVMLVGCSEMLVKMNYKDRFMIPPEDFVLDNSILRSDGYYFKIESRTHYSDSLSDRLESPKLQRLDSSRTMVRAMVLYKDGSFYYPRNTVYYATPVPQTDMLNRQDSMRGYNAYDFDLSDIEESLKARKSLENPRYAQGIYEKGVYNILENKSIVLQSYQGWPASEYTVEERGQILNDSTFVLKTTELYERGKTTVVQDTFRFKAFTEIPPPVCYILENRDEFGQ